MEPRTDPLRIRPVTDPSDAVTHLFERGGLRAPSGAPLNIFATMAHHPDLLRRWLVFATHVLTKSTLPARDRELLILRTGWRCRSQYEFSQHAVIGLSCDLTVIEIEATKSHIEAAVWSEHDAALLRAADELHDESRISDRTWATLAATYSMAQLLDVLATVGNYHLVAYVLNSAGVELDEGVAPAL